MPVLVAALLRVVTAKPPVCLSMRKGTDKHAARPRRNGAQLKRNATQVNSAAWTNLKDRPTKYVRHGKC